MEEVYIDEEGNFTIVSSMFDDKYELGKPPENNLFTFDTVYNRMYFFNTDVTEIARVTKEKGLEYLTGL